MMWFVFFSVMFSNGSLRQNITLTLRTTNYVQLIILSYLEWRNQLAFLACQIKLQPQPPALSCQQQGIYLSADLLPLFCQGGLIMKSPNVAYF